MEVAFKVFDEMLKEVFCISKANQPLVATNSLSQECCIEAKEFLYRQKNPEQFFRQIGLKFLSIEQAMTNDGHIFFETIEQRDASISILTSIRVSGKTAFHVDLSTKNPLSVFCQFVLWEMIHPSATLDLPGKSFNFYDLFECVTQRSGSHIPEGDIYSSGITFPDEISNTEIFSRLIAYFKAK